jgi:phospholipid-binding lipoprotein MlaA
MIIAAVEEKTCQLELQRDEVETMKCVQPVRRAKIISLFFLSVAFAFTIITVPCSAETSSSREEEVTVVGLWPAPGPAPGQAQGQALGQNRQRVAASESPPPSEPLDPTAFNEEESSDTSTEEAISRESIPDPIEPVNRAFFHFNDKLYFWVLKPVATGYKAVISEDFRVCFRNFFSNLLAPVRVANCLLQGEFKGAGNEAARFGINTTFGFFGFHDQGKDHFDIDKQDRDFGQTLGKWGLGPAFYINWPILGPSSLRDTAGLVGDYFMDPQTYLVTLPVSIGIRSYKTVNETSLTIGDYEAIKKAALDPYVAVRDGYYQYRENKIKKK